MTFEELTAVARQAVNAIDGSTSTPVTVIVVVANAQPHAGDLTRFACETNCAHGRDVARVCRDVARFIEGAS